MTKNIWIILITGLFFFFFNTSISLDVNAQSCTGVTSVSCPDIQCRRTLTRENGKNWYTCVTNPVIEQLNCFYQDPFGCGTYRDATYGCTPGWGWCTYYNPCDIGSARDWVSCAVQPTSAPNPPTPTPTPAPVCKKLGDTCSGGGGNCCSGACANGVCCKANGASCSGGGGSCCSGYCNGTSCANTPTPTPPVCPNYNGEVCAGNPPGGQCQTSPTCSVLPIGGPCSVGGLPGTYAFNLCPGGGETRCCVPNPTPIPTNTPTPTPRPPTPTPTPRAWFKLRDSTLVGRIFVNSPIPVPPLTPYDSSDPGRRVLIDNLPENTPGVLSGRNIEIGGAPASLKGWKVQDRVYETQYTVQKYIEYVRANKSDSVLEITQINDAVSGKINILTSPPQFPSVTLTDGQLEAKRPFVLVVIGDVVLTSANINPSNEPQAIIATGKIDFNTSVREANGLYIANDIDFGLTANQGIKVIGNIIAQNSFRNERQWGDPKKPGLFIIFDPSHYIELFDMLSSPRYEWRQLQ